MMASEKRLIDANALPLGKFPNPRTEWHQGWNDALDAATFAAETVDAVEVVRCKDCKHWREADDGRSWQMIGRTDGACRWLAEQHYAERYMTEGEHFCSYGERKDNG